MSFSLLFVCTGNTCRSPIAEVLAENRDVVADSAGVAAQRGDGAAPFADRALRIARGLSLQSHTPKAVEALDLSSFSCVVAMTPSVATQLRSRHDIDPDRIVTWSIADPYGGALADYRYCVEQIDMALDRFLSRKNWTRRTG